MKSTQQIFTCLAHFWQHICYIFFESYPKHKKNVFYFRFLQLFKIDTITVAFVGFLGPTTCIPAKVINGAFYLRFKRLKGLNNTILDTKILQKSPTFKSLTIIKSWKTRLFRHIFYSKFI